MICGVDEAGRGPLAGPVYAAAVILDPDRPIVGLVDSKTISAKRRERLALAVHTHAKAWAVGVSSVEEIDRINILQATLLAMKRAILSLGFAPTEVLVDGNSCPDIDLPVRAIIKGDATVPEISAASILAKTARDAEMRRLHQLYPQYGFDRHFGYGTAKHMEMLKQYGPSDCHRASFAPIRKLLIGGG